MASPTSSPTFEATAQLFSPDANRTKDSGDEGSVNPLKRRGTDAGLDYPRRRATIACEICRSRKSRCDGSRPKCKLCTDLGAECVYREPGIKLDAGDKLILEQLRRIEGMLQRSLSTAPAGNSSSSSSTAITCGVTLPQRAASVAAALGPQQTTPSHNSQPTFANGNGLALAGMNGLASLWPEPPAMHPSIEASAGGAGDYVSVISAGGIGTWTIGTNNISTMPKTHTNAALHLLQWPLIRDLVSRPYDPQILLQLEMGREPLHLPPAEGSQTWPIDLANAAAYSAAYFDRVNVWYACVNPYSWRRLYRTAQATGFRASLESCVVLLVLALGQASLRGSISRIFPASISSPQRQQQLPGFSFFSAASALLPSLMTTNSVLAAQCHLLAAAYLFYLVRPLEAWNMLCTTSTKLQLLLMAPSQRVPPAQRELMERIFWNTLLFESDLLAELDLPHSGIVQFEENVGLPCGFDRRGEDGETATDEEEEDEGEEENGGDGDYGVHEIYDRIESHNNALHSHGHNNNDGITTNGGMAGYHSLSLSTTPTGTDELWYFLAEIALRRLLNRVSQLIYARSSTTLSSPSSPSPHTSSTASLAPLMTELDFQLTQWYENLPRPLQFSFARAPLPHPVQTVLRLRFFACRTIIYRPYILSVLENEQTVLDPAVRESCHKCLEAAVRQLEHVTAHHAGHMPYLWQGALSITSQALLVMGASMSPSLATILLTIVPRRDVLDCIIGEVVAEVERYAVLAPSLQLAAEILQEAEARRRTYLNR